jgi:hypothetical protein
MDKAITLVKGLSDLQTISLLKQLYGDIFKAVPFNEIEAHLPPDMEEIKILFAIDREVKKKNLASSDSVEGAQKILMAFAQDENLAPILMQAWNEIKDDDSLFIEAIIAVGLLANLTIFIASSDIEFNIGKLKVKKHKTNANVVKEVLKPVIELIKKI